MTKDEHLSERTDKIRQLNDLCRRLYGNGIIRWAGDLAHADNEVRVKALQAVATFNAFDEGDDPYGEHDFGAFTLDGERFMFKIEYYDENYEFGADDPADPIKTRRVLSIFYARDY